MPVLLCLLCKFELPGSTFHHYAQVFQVEGKKGICSSGLDLLFFCLVCPVLALFPCTDALRCVSDSKCEQFHASKVMHQSSRTSWPVQSCHVTHTPILLLIYLLSRFHLNLGGQNCDPEVCSAAEPAGNHSQCRPS